MGLLDKVKNFFFEEEDDDEDEINIKPENHHREQKKEKNVQSDEITERELFSAERTFNFPIDVDDDTKYLSRTSETNLREEKYRENDIKETNYGNRNSYNDNSYRNYSSTYSVNTQNKKNKQEEVVKFKPTPVISPIYGVLDKNYTKEDVAIDATREFNMPKKLDYDSVRKKAYGNMYSNTEEEDSNKGIFFNLNEEKTDEYDEDDVKITYNDVSFEEDAEEEKDEEIVPNVKINEEEDDDELSETKEQDLFNLIDNMYNSDDIDEEENE